MGQGLHEPREQLWVGWELGSCMHIGPCQWGDSWSREQAREAPWEWSRGLPGAAPAPFWDLRRSEPLTMQGNSNAFPTVFIGAEICQGGLLGTQSTPYKHTYSQDMWLGQS